MMKILNNIIQTFKVPVPLFDRILEVVALFMLVILLVFTAILYQQAPEQIPIQFDGNNNPRDWGEKGMYWYMASFYIALMLLTSAAAYNQTKLVNIPIRLKEAVIGLQKQLIGRMCRCITLCLGIMWLDYLLSTMASYWDIVLFVSIFSKISIVLLFAVLIYFTVKIWWIGRRY